MTVWAKLFETNSGQLLATIEHSDEDDTYGLRLRWQAPTGASVSATPGGWPTIDKAYEALEMTDQAMADGLAQNLSKMSKQFSGTLHDSK